MKESLFDPIPHSLNTLALLYRYAPGSDEFGAVANYFASDSWHKTWVDIENIPSYQLQERDKVLNKLKTLSLSDWKQYFGLEYSLPVPPWGAVYMDPEQAMNTETTIAVEKFLARYQIELNTGAQEPVDHIGLMLMIMAHLAHVDNYPLLEEFYRSHMAPWVYIYLSKLQELPLPDVIDSFVKLTEWTLSIIFNESLSSN
ncbi:molecular chaperone TorD family protein [Photobacterium sagamiensis]|uniref:molecular chaperone TorD family protein n=1 Tax=Photobacterium sagamiensis TaxID=2910241 RepID=UPI003D0E75EA